MELKPGQALGHYRIVGKIGEGGMGVVWEGEDTRLHRKVAIKALPATFEDDAERVERFNREARVLASLNHPHIAGIHGLEEHQGVRFLVMELVPGRDLFRRLAEGPLPVEEALELARQMADALEAAHESGVIHRDLKPANVQLTPDGTIKILDFGLAKALESDLGSASSSLSPTLTTPATREGVILGTAAYMSPEQAKAKRVDRRADIWAFGCVLYEMLCGVRPFRGEGISETLAAVIMSSPEMAALPAAVPPAAHRLLERCLEKDPRRRLRDMGDARVVLEDILAGRTGEDAAAASGRDAASRRRSASPWLLGAVALAAAVVAAGAAWWLRPASPPPPVRRYELSIEAPGRSGASGKTLAISPDGRYLAWASRKAVHIRPMDRLEPISVEVADEPLFIFWSPDSRWLGFGLSGRLLKVAATGGTPSVITDQAGDLSGGTGASWTDDDRILLARGDPGLYEVSARGGDIVPILEADTTIEGDYHQPCALPGGRGYLFVVHAVGGRPDRLELFAGGERRTLLHLPDQTIWDPFFAASGHILYRREPTNPGIWALPFDLDSLQATGEPFLVAAAGDLASASRDGTLIYVSGASSRKMTLAWLGMDGAVQELPVQPQAMWPFPALSPDGLQAAVAATEGEKREIWIHDLERGTKTRLTFDARMANHGNWSPDGSRFVFPDGTNPPTPVRIFSIRGRSDSVELDSGWDPAFTPDGRTLVFAQQKPDDANDWDIRMLDLVAGGEPETVVEGAGWQLWPQVSPDGRWLAYLSDESGSDQVFLTAFAEAGRKWQVSTDGGQWPRWAPAGDALYYVRGDTFYRVAFEADPEPRLGRSEKVVDRPSLRYQLPFAWSPGYSLSPDGKRFLICKLEEVAQGRTGIVVVERWVDDFGSRQLGER